jgi:glutathione S-transferase
MKLYHHPASTVSRMVMLFAAEEGIALEYVLVDLMSGAQHQPDYKAINRERGDPALPGRQDRFARVPGGAAGAGAGG